MSIHQTAPADWVPVNDAILDQLGAQYRAWISNLTEIRERMAELRKAVNAGWTPDEQSQSNLDRLNANDEHCAAKQMGTARTVLLCAEYAAGSFLPGPNRQGEILAAILATTRPKPTPEEILANRIAMLEGRMPMPAGSERQMLRAILKEMLQTKKALH